MVYLFWGLLFTVISKNIICVTWNHKNGTRKTMSLFDIRRSGINACFFHYPQPTELTGWSLLVRAILWYREEWNLGSTNDLNTKSAHKNQENKLSVRICTNLSSRSATQTWKISMYRDVHISTSPPDCTRLHQTPPASSFPHHSNAKQCVKHCKSLTIPPCQSNSFLPSHTNVSNQFIMGTFQGQVKVRNKRCIAWAGKNRAPVEAIYWAWL